jgi:hypothetical protein
VAACEIDIGTGGRYEFVVMCVAAICKERICTESDHVCLSVGCRVIGGQSVW